MVRSENGGRGGPTNDDGARRQLCPTHQPGPTTHQRPARYGLPSNRLFGHLSFLLIYRPIWTAIAPILLLKTRLLLFLTALRPPRAPHGGPSSARAWLQSPAGHVPDSSKAVPDRRGRRAGRNGGRRAAVQWCR